jgi:hypothetical protein
MKSLNDVEMSYEESVSYFKGLENSEKIRRTNFPNPFSIPKDNKKLVSVTIIVGSSSKNHQESSMWSHYCDKNNHNTADCRAIDTFKWQKKACFEAKDGPVKKSLALLVKEILCIQKAVEA